MCPVLSLIKTIKKNTDSKLITPVNGVQSNGLLGKIHEVKVLLLTLKFDVLAITETHL